jgi:predicted cupin superfamily sugar epimerase
MTRIEEIIKSLNLLPHPEGGYYKETYRSVGNINTDSLDESYNGKRSYSTCIYFLLTSGNFSAFHKIKQDEIWHFHEGSPIKLHTISENGIHQEYIIGNNFSAKQEPQLVVNGNHWFAASINEENSYALVSCTVSPGFDFNDFILPKRSELISKFPQHKELIQQYTVG